MRNDRWSVLGCGLTIAAGWLLWFAIILAHMLFAKGVRYSTPLDELTSGAFGIIIFLNKWTVSFLALPVAGTATLLWLEFRLSHPGLIMVIRSAYFVVLSFVVVAVLCLLNKGGTL